MGQMTREQAMQIPRVARALAEADAEHAAREQRKQRSRAALAEAVAVGTAEKKERLPWAPYRSKLEWLYAEHLDAMQRAGRIDGWQYEPCSFRLPGRLRYRPDFVRWTAGGRPVFIELKPARDGVIAGKNARDTITRLKSAAAAFPWAEWLLVKGERGVFTETQILGES